MEDIVSDHNEGHNSDSSLDVGGLSLGNAPDLKSTEVDVASLALSQDYASLVTVSAQTGRIEITRPSRLEFIRTHPVWVFLCAMLEIDFEHWVLAPSLFPRYFREAAAKMLVPAITRRGTVFLWPIKLPTLDLRLDRWNQTAKYAADLARTKWVRLVSNRKLGDYDIEVAEGIEDPTWPEDITSMEQLLGKAFVDKVIDNENHRILLRLAGKD